MPKYCRNCGKPIGNSASFCSSCGANIESFSPPAAKQQASNHQPKAYCRPVLFRIVASALIVILTISAVKKLLPRDEFLIAPPDKPTYTTSCSDKAEISTAPVSPENPIAVIGPVSVDMKPWNLNGEDEIIVKQFPEKTDASGYITLREYDFSLKSGQSQFTTSAWITLPVTANDDEEGSVVYLNEDTGEWEYIAYDLSEDGKCYVVYMPHFSTIAEKKVKDYVGMENDIRTVTGDLKTKGSLYQYGSYTTLSGEFIPIPERSVYMSEDSFRRLYLSIDTEELRKILLVAKLPTQDATAFALGTLNNAQSITDAAILLSRLENSLSAAGKIRLSGCMGGFGAALTAGRIAYQANHGGSFSQILWENKFNITESLLGALSFGAEYVGAAGAASVFSVAAVSVFVGSLAYDVYEDATKYDSYEERVYQFFLDQGKSKLGISGLPGYDNKDKLYPDGKNFDKVLKAIYENYADEPQKLDAAVANMYYSYAGYFWKYLYPDQREEFAKKEYAGEVIGGLIQWTEPTEEQKQKYVERTVARLASETEPMLRALAYDALAKMRQELYKTIHLEVQPYLNRTLTFVVKDKNLKNGESFSSSPYAAHGIRFDDKTAPQFTAKYLDLSVYTEDKYTPVARNNSDIVYKCNMYHYIQMGCPTIITFEGNPEAQLPAQTLSFTIDDTGSGDIIVTLELEEVETPVVSNSYWLGTWTYTYSYQSVVMPGSGEKPETINVKDVIEVSPYNKDGYDFKIITTTTHERGGKVETQRYENLGKVNPYNSDEMLYYRATGYDVFRKADQNTITAGSAEYKR